MMSVQYRLITARIEKNMSISFILKETPIAELSKLNDVEKSDVLNKDCRIREVVARYGDAMKQTN